MSAYIATTPLHLALWDAGGEVEVEAVITYSVTKYRPAARLEPEELPMVENVSIKLRDLKTKEELSLDQILERFSEGDSFQSWLMSESADRDEYACDCAAEAKMEERRLGLS